MLGSCELAIIELPQEVEPEDLPCCPLCDQPIDYGEKIAIGMKQHPFGRSFCLVHYYCAMEDE